MIGKLLRIKAGRDDVSLYPSRQGTVRTPLRPGDVLCRLPINANEAVVYPAEIYVMSGLGCGWVRGEATEDL
jgi:hypothetical protein